MTLLGFRRIVDISLRLEHLPCFIETGMLNCVTKMPYSYVYTRCMNSQSILCVSVQLPQSSNQIELKWDPSIFTSYIRSSLVTLEKKHMNFIVLHKI